MYTYLCPFIPIYTYITYTDQIISNILLSEVKFPATKSVNLIQYRAFTVFAVPSNKLQLFFKTRVDNGFNDAFFENITCKHYIKQILERLDLLGMYVNVVY